MIRLGAARRFASSGGSKLQQILSRSSRVQQRHVQQPRMLFQGSVNRRLSTTSNHRVGQWNHQLRFRNDCHYSFTNYHRVSFSCLVFGYTTWLTIGGHKTGFSLCESQIVLDNDHQGAASNVRIVVKMKNNKKEQNKTVWSQIKHVLRLIRRLLKLTIALTPVVALYPIQSLLLHNSKKGTLLEDDKLRDAQEIVLSSLSSTSDAINKTTSSKLLNLYYQLCLYCIEWSGAAPIKIMQWAGSRPDMFGAEFCSIFSQLQDDTTPHSWAHTRRELQKSFGGDWSSHIELGEILGSGCIAQVYKGIISDDDGKQQEVAVKVMHPNVEDDIDCDLDLMRLSYHILERLPFDVFKNIKWLNVPGFIDEMEHMLKIQLDLRTEAHNLERFDENFKDNDLIIFPKLIDGYEPTKSVLVETFCEGKPIMEYIRTNTEDRKILSEMCHGATEAVCQMIFLDNFLHGKFPCSSFFVCVFARWMSPPCSDRLRTIRLYVADLHPGNVLITPDRKFVLLDCGIVTEHSREDHRLISDVLSAFIYCQPRKAGRRMIEDSNSRLRGVGDHAIDEELFIDKIEKIGIEARGKGYLMEKLGTYISYICNAAATHHVMINQSFMSAALAVKVQEGIALALDPSIEIWKVAVPIIIEGERRQGFVKERAQEMLGLGRFINWITGKENPSKEEAPKYLSKLPSYKK